MDKNINYDELYLKQLEKIKKQKDRLENLKKKKEQQAVKSLYQVFGNHFLNQNEIKRLEKLLKDNNNELLNKILDNPVSAEKANEATEDSSKMLNNAFIE